MQFSLQRQFILEPRISDHDHEHRFRNTILHCGSGYMRVLLITEKSISKIFYRVTGRLLQQGEKAPLGCPDMV